MNNNPFDVHASYEGIFTALDKLNREKEIESMIDKYTQALDDLGLPAPFIAKGIVNTLENYADLKNCNTLIKRLKDDGKST